MKSPRVERVLRRIRSVGTFWIAEQTLEHLENIRTHELGIVLSMLPPRGRVLEIGAGAGWQARALEDHGYDVSGIDLTSSVYRMNRVWPVTEYDGKTIPFEDGTFDIIFTSNTLEHIKNIYAFQNEIRRVTKEDGVVLHILPSGTWRFWTNLTHVAKLWTIPKTHGEHSRNSLTEIFHFSRRWWMRLFRETGWTVVVTDSNRLFYTGNLIMDHRLSISMRGKLSRALGSSCNIFLLRQ